MKLGELVLEVGTNPLPYQLNVDDEYWEMLCPELNLAVYFSRGSLFRTNSYDAVFIEFAVGDRKDMTGKGNEIKILSTVKNILERELKGFIDPGINYVSFGAEREDLSRVKLYARRAVPIVGQLLGPGWEVFDNNSADRSIESFTWKRKNGKIREAIALVEIGDKPGRVEVTDSSANFLNLEARDIGLDIEFTRSFFETDQDDTVFVEFKVNGSYSTKPNDRYVEILSTVADSLRNYLPRFIKDSDDYVFFSADIREKSRVKFYDHRAVPLISRILGSGWEMTQPSYSPINGKVYMWKRKARKIEEKAVQSTWITDLVHTRKEKYVTMRLSNGRQFRIPGINRLAFEKWVNSPSKGRYWHANIKGNYQVTRLK